MSQEKPAKPAAPVAPAVEERTAPPEPAAPPGAAADSPEAIAAELDAAERRAAAAAAEPEPDEAPAEAEAPEAEEPEAEPEPEPTDTFTVQTPDGPQQVKLDELISGYTRHSDYTRKTQAVAAERQAIAQERRRFAAEQQAVAERIGPLIQATMQALEAEDVAGLEELKLTDPGAWSARMVERQHRAEHAARLREEQVRLQAEARAAAVPLERQALASKAPEFTRDFAGVYSRVGAYVMASGFTPDEWNGLIDHRQVLMAYKAMKYDELATRARQPKVKQRLERLPRAARPGVPKAPGEQRRDRVVAARKDAFERGTVESIARYLEQSQPI